MRDPDAFYAAFATALQSGRTDALDAVAGPPATGSRFRVYRNNVVRGAVEALRAAYPAVERLIGPRLFDELARRYRLDHPPDSPTLILYGEDFPGCLETAPPVSSLPWLADVARHDRAWLEAHHAADTAAMRGADAAALNPDILTALAPGLHPSVHLLVSDWPAHTIWHRNRICLDNSPVTAQPGRRFSMVWRQNGAVRSRTLSAPEHAFFKAIADGAPLGAAATTAAHASADFDAAAAFAAALTDALLKGPLQ